MKTFKSFIVEAVSLPDDYVAKVVSWIIDEPVDTSKLKIQRSGSYLSVYYNGSYNDVVAKQQLNKAGLKMKSDGNGEYFEKSKAVIELGSRLSISDLNKFATVFTKAVGKPPKELSDAEIVKMIVDTASKLKPYKQKVIGTAAKMDSIMSYATKVYDNVNGARASFIKELEKQAGVESVSFSEFDNTYSVKTEDGRYKVEIDQIDKYGGIVINVKG